MMSEAPEGSGWENGPGGGSSSSSSSFRPPPKMPTSSAFLVQLLEQPVLGTGHVFRPVLPRLGLVHRVGRPRHVAVVGIDPRALALVLRLHRVTVPDTH